MHVLSILPHDEMVAEARDGIEDQVQSIARFYTSRTHKGVS